MRKFKLLVVVSLIWGCSQFSILTAETQKPSIMITDAPSSSVAKEYVTQLNSAVTQYLKNSEKFVLKDKNQVENMLKNLGIRTDDLLDEQKAINAGIKTGSDLVLVLASIYKNNQFSLRIKVLESGSRVLCAEVKKEYKDIKDMVGSLPEILDYLIERIFLVNDFFVQNYLFYTQTPGIFSGKNHGKLDVKLPNATGDAFSEATAGSQEPDSGNFFYQNRFYLALQGAYNQPVLSFYNLLYPLFYIGLQMDYALLVSDYFVVSPLVDVNFFFHNALSQLNTFSQITVIGASGGASVALTLPVFRALSFHLDGALGLALSFIKLKAINKTVTSLDPMLSAKFEIRYTLFDRFSASVFADYLAVLFQDSTLQDVQLGVGLGYRF